MFKKLIDGFWKQPQPKKVEKEEKKAPRQKEAEPQPQPKPKKKTPEKKAVKKKAKQDRAEKERREEERRLERLVKQLEERESKLDQQRESLDDHEKFLREKESRLDKLEDKLKSKETKLDKLEKEEEERLEEAASLSKQEARQELKKKTEKRLTKWVAKRVREAREAIKAQEEDIAQEVLLESIRHGVVDWVAEYTVSTIKLKDEDVKGRIIGREGRNIRSFERATGVDLELDETNVVRLSSFEPVRREIAKIALKKLIKDGRIQPSRIEEVVEQTRKQMEKKLVEEGKRICQAVGVYHLPIDLVKMVGKFKYRFSHGQNLAQHTIEEAKIGVQLAQELNADVKIVRLSCLLHDVGKVVVDKEGSHVDLGVELLKQYQIPEEVIAAVAEHHEDKPFSSKESVITYIADAASGSRPGARYEAHEQYLERMENIEETVNSFEGVKDVAAYQAGREVRVIVEPSKVSDDELTVMVQRMAEKLDEEAKWAGQIRVTAIRETRAAAKAPVDKSR
jgi:ribonuclease Y